MNVTYLVEQETVRLMKSAKGGILHYGCTRFKTHYFVVYVSFMPNIPMMIFGKETSQEKHKLVLLPVSLMAAASNDENKSEQQREA